jgi:pyruvate dehydrogenase E2 component (dihydrolipoamide acetyltransferase)
MPDNRVDVRVPDIGDFKDVPVIEVLVKPGDAVKANDSLITLESEKASMEVPSPAEGIVESVSVKAGDRVSQGSVILALGPAQETASGAAGQETASAAAAQEQHVVELRVPDIGDFKDVPVIDVLVNPGDTIEKEASLVTLESEKATLEVPATSAGTIRDVKVKVGDKVSQGDVIATVSSTEVKETAAKAPSPQADRTQTSREAAAPVTAPPLSAPPVAGAAASASQISGNGAVHASPSIRRFARELGVDLHNVSPSGPNGRVTREDVQAFVKRSLQDGTVASTSRTPGLEIPAWPSVDFTKYGQVERKPLSRIKKLSGPNLHRNWVMIPHVTQNDDADVTDLEEFRSELNRESQSSGVKVTMLAFLITASVAALKKFPDFNASLDGEDLVYKKYYHIGFAADTPEGLLVPVVRDADKKGIRHIAQETADLARKAREGKIGASEMQGGTFTISSLGSIGGTYFTPIINAPEVAILGACRAAVRPHWDGSQFVPRLMQPLSLSYDHRVIDGASAARFTTYVASVLSDLRKALL